MSKHLAFLYTFVILSGPVIAHLNAQEPAEPPLVHTVTFPTGDATWTVTFEKEEQAGGKPAKKLTKDDHGEEQITIVRTGKLRHDVETFTDGNTMEIWWNFGADVAFLKESADKPFAAVSLGKMTGRYDQSYFSWVSAGKYQGMVVFHEKKCRYYMEEVAERGHKDTLEVWIDNKTAKPVGFGTNGLVGIFNLDLPAPTTPLTLPDDIQKLQDRLNRFYPAAMPQHL